MATRGGRNVDDQNLTGQKFQNVEMVSLVDQNVKNQKDQNVENVFWVDHYYDITTSKMAFELITTSKRMKRTSKRSVLSEFHILTTYGVSTYCILVLTKTF